MLVIFSAGIALILWLSYFFNPEAHTNTVLLSAVITSFWYYHVVTLDKLNDIKKKLGD